MPDTRLQFAKVAADFPRRLMDCEKNEICNYCEGISTSPELIPSIMSCGGCPSTVQPILCAVPKISLTHPDSSFASDFDFIVRAISTISSSVTLPECLMFFSFLRSRGGSKIRYAISKMEIKPQRGRVSYL